MTRYGFSPSDLSADTGKLTSMPAERVDGGHYDVQQTWRQ
jgi:hypothetical protein